MKSVCRIRQDWDTAVKLSRYVQEESVSVVIYGHAFPCK